MTIALCAVGCSKHNEGSPQGDASFFNDLDEIVFQCSRSFHGTIIVRLEKDRAKGKVTLQTEVVADRTDATPTRTRKEVPMRVFDELERESRGRSSSRHR